VGVFTDFRSVDEGLQRGRVTHIGHGGPARLTGWTIPLASAANGERAPHSVLPALFAAADIRGLHVARLLSGR